MTAADPAARRLQFSFTGLPPDVMPRVEAVEAFLLQAGCTAASARNFAVIAEEILSNIARHAFPNRRGDCTVEVIAIAGADGVGVTLRTDDDGVAFDPTRAPAPDLDTPLQQRPLGGLGITLIRTMTDRQTYRREAGRNVFEVTRICPRDPAPNRH